MAEGSMNSEVPNKVSNWAKLKNFLIQRGRKQAVSVSSAEQALQASNQEEAGLGYSELVEKFKAGNDQRVAYEMTLLYPEMVALLQKPADGHANLQINKTWGVAMTEEERALVSDALKAGNPKTIAVLAFYVSEKASGDLPLEISVKNPQQGFKEARNITRFYGQKARDLQAYMEKYVRKIGGEAFSVEEMRNKWSDISRPIVNYDKETLRANALKEAGEMQSSTVRQNPAQSPSIQK